MGVPSLGDLPHRARVGTTSPRRRALLLDARPDLEVVDLRGNVDTRLARLAAGEFDAIVLARAGLDRLGLFDGLKKVAVLDPATFVPAAGQGALAVQCRRDDRETRKVLASLDDAATRRCVDAERAVVVGLDGDCHSPIGAHAGVDGAGVRLIAAYHDGRCLRRATGTAADDVVRALLM